MLPKSKLLPGRISCGRAHFHASSNNATSITLPMDAVLDFVEPSVKRAELANNAVFFFFSFSPAF